MRHERLDKELSEDTSDVLNLLFLASSCFNPCSCFVPSLVQGEETALSSSLDQLIWLSDKLGTWCLEEWKCGLGLIEDGADLLVLWEVDRGQLSWRVVCARRLQWCWLDDWCSSKVVVEDGLAISFKNRFGSHGECKMKR